MNPPSKTEWAVGLYSYPEKPAQNSTYLAFYDAVARLLTRQGLVLTHFAAEGNGFTGKLTKWQTHAAKRLVDSAFEDITVLSLVVSSEGSKDPAYDRVIYASLS